MLIDDLTIKNAIDDPSKFTHAELGEIIEDLWEPQKQGDCEKCENRERAMEEISSAMDYLRSADWRLDDAVSALQD